MIKKVFLLMVLLLASCGGNPNKQSGGQEPTGLSISQGSEGEIPSGEISYFTTDLAQGANQGILPFSLVVKNLGTGSETSKPVDNTKDAFSPYWNPYTWSPDGNKLAITVYGTIATKDYATGKIEYVSVWSEEAEYYPSRWAFFGLTQLTWVKTSEEGDRLFFDCLRSEIFGNPPTEHPGICTFNLGSKTWDYFTLEPGLTSFDVEYLYVSASADGKTVAFVRRIKTDTVGGSDEVTLFVQNTETGEVRQLNIGGLYPNFAKISPQGNRVAFVSGPEGNTQTAEIWIINTDGTDLRQITQKEFDPDFKGWFDWSKDGSWIVFERGTPILYLMIENSPYQGDSQNSDIWMVEVSSGRTVQITNTPQLIEVMPLFRPNH